MCPSLLIQRINNKTINRSERQARWN